MLIDARRWSGGDTVETEVCVIGGGAAGITLARELAAQRRDVVLLESGGFEYDEPTQMLYAGSTGDGVPQPEKNYLKLSRLRFLGGTTNHWEGWCRPLEEIDMAPREWVPMSGWPIERSALDPYYVRACDHLQIPSLSEGSSDAEDDPDRFLFPPDSSLQTKLFHQSPPMRFGRFYGRELTDSQRIRLFLWANAVELESNAAGTAVERVAVATLSGKRFSVRARFTVLAAGAVETARLLLVSNHVHEAGLGNGSDMVGRCFMEHPRIEGIGAVALLRRGAALRTYAIRRIDERRLVWGGLAPSPAKQREHGLLNTCFVFADEQPEDLGAHVAEIAGAIDRFGARSGSAPLEAPAHARVDIICEQAPNRESRIRLGDEKDAFGRPRARLDWRLAEIDRTSVRDSLALLARQLGGFGIGRGAFFVEETAPWRDVITSGHHIGTTRMSVDPKDGVVDPTMRVHAVQNLYVASSATFPTSGLASPTPTIVALAIRLADHLVERLA